MIHDQKRVDAIRKHASERIKLIEDWEAKVRDQYIRGQLHMLKNCYSDVEGLFLSSLNREDRTAEQEARWLTGAETYIKSAESRLAGLLEPLGEFGPKIQTIG